MKNRKLEFRIWDKAENEFAKPSEYGSAIEWFEGCEDNLDSLVIQQFTGLLDRSGKKIFEGDIIEFSRKDSRDCGPVVFSPSCAAFVIDSSGRHLIDDKYGDYIPLSKYVTYSILGNIFESCKTTQKKNTTTDSLI